MRLSGFGLWLLGPLALTSCIAALDFDELQKGSGGSAGSGAGTQATGGADGGGASEGGAGACDCDDSDPCTLDTCTGVDGACEHEAIQGLALDGVNETVPAEHHWRVTMTGGPDAFFYSVLSTNGDDTDVTLYRLGAKEDASEAKATLSSLELPGSGSPVSAAGLAVDTKVGLQVHAFLGLANASGSGARPWHVVFNGKFEPTLNVPVGESYWTENPTVHPDALNIGGKVYGAWINADRQVEVSEGAGENAFFAADTETTTLSLFAGADDEPAVLYSGSPEGVFVENAAGVAAAEECQPGAGLYLSSSATPIGIAGFWFVSWTKAGDEYLRNESKIAACGPEGCFIDQNDCGSLTNTGRNGVSVSAQRPGDAAGLIHYVTAQPYLAPSEDGESVLAGLALNMARIDFGPDPFAEGSETTFEAVGELLTIAEAPTSAPDYRGPDWPAMSYVGPNKVGLAWIQPNAAGDGDELRIQRYEMCIGE